MSTTITTPEDFERYARWVADNLQVSPEFAIRLLAAAAKTVRW
jgi:hypothetical protein